MKLGGKGKRNRLRRGGVLCTSLLLGASGCPVPGLLAMEAHVSRFVAQTHTCASLAPSASSATAGPSANGDVHVGTLGCKGLDHCFVIAPTPTRESASDLVREGNRAWSVFHSRNLSQQVANRRVLIGLYPGLLYVFTSCAYVPVLVPVHVYVHSANAAASYLSSPSRAAILSRHSLKACSRADAESGGAGLTRLYLPSKVEHIYVSSPAAL